MPYLCVTFDYCDVSVGLIVICTLVFPTFQFYFGLVWRKLICECQGPVKISFITLLKYYECVLVHNFRPIMNKYIVHSITFRIAGEYQWDNGDVPF